MLVPLTTRAHRTEASYISSTRAFLTTLRASPVTWVTYVHLRVLCTDKHVDGWQRVGRLLGLFDEDELDLLRFRSLCHLVQAAPLDYGFRHTTRVSHNG